jgi:GDPmannose 4,6-dehydratase
VDEVGVDSDDGKVLIEVDPRYYRPTEVDILVGDPAKAKENLGWKPNVGFEELVSVMVEEDLEKF